MISNTSGFQKKKREQISGTVLGGFFAVLFSAIAIFLIANNIVLNQKRMQLQQKANDLKTQLEQLQTQKANLEQGIGKAQTQEYQEKILREQGFYKKPGEEVITILPSETEITTEPVQSEKVWWDPRSWF